jgi:threonine dehydratase
MNAALSLDAASLQKGLATHSSGNHAQAIAYAARVLGTQAFIVMPNNSPKVKVDAVSGYGAEITFCEPNQEARELTLKQVLDRTGATFIHPYNDERVITGQATCVKELIEQVNGLDIVIAPVGGGGLLSGTSLGIHYFSPQTKVYAGEPEGAADAVLSFRTGKIEKAPFINTIADGLLTSLGNLTLPIIRQGVTDILTVSDQEIIDSLRLVYERMKIVVEPSCVVTLAAVLRYPDIFKKKRVGLILTGGNVDLTKLSGWFSSGKGVQ